MQPTEPQLRPTEPTQQPSYLDLWKFTSPYDSILDYRSKEVEVSLIAPDKAMNAPIQQSMR